ncbi:MAG TPA: PPOX class F420-dependent oxidoreductase [Candidatus Limnocylindria bacterium]|nr:PPOX class F420-dependent oxidoreductase [Candidatus Limnocylindria bacterium]
MQTRNDTLAPLAGATYARLTTYRGDGSAVATPVHIVVDAGRAFFRTWAPTGKLKRLRRNPLADVAPATVTGRPTGPGLRMRARILDGDEWEHARRLIEAKHPILHRLIPIVHRLRGQRTVHVELVPLAADEARAGDAAA